MERKPSPHPTSEVTQSSDKLEHVLFELNVHPDVSRAIQRFKGALFTDHSKDYPQYLLRASSFHAESGYVAGERKAQGYRNDTLGQLTGTVGQLQEALIFAKNEGRELTDKELTRAQKGLKKASMFREQSASDYKSSAPEIAEVRSDEATWLHALSENVPTMIRVMQRLEEDVA